MASEEDKEADAHNLDKEMSAKRASSVNGHP